MTERVLNLVTYIQWEKPQVIEYDKICNGLKALCEMLSIYSYIIISKSEYNQIDILTISGSLSPAMVVKWITYFMDNKQSTKV